MLRLKRPAKENIGLDLDAALIEKWRCSLQTAMVATPDENGESRRRRTPETAIAAEITKNGDARSRSAETGDNRSPHAETGDGSRKLLTPSEPAMGSETGEIGDGGPPSEPAILPAAASPGPARVDVAEFRFLSQDGIKFLAGHRFTGSELVYCDPPYLLSTRGHRRIYRYELKDSQHRKLLSTIVRLPCMVMISGYWSEMYATALKDWSSISFESMTRGGRPATEWLWYNFPEPVALHDYRYLGKNFRERERIKRKKLRWVNRLERMPLLEKRALLSAIASIAGNDGARAAPQPAIRPGGPQAPREQIDLAFPVSPRTAEAISTGPYPNRLGF